MFVFHKPVQALYALLIITMVFLGNTAMADSGDPKAAKLAWPMVGNGALLIDVRSPEEFEEGHIKGAINIDWKQSEVLMTAIGDNKQRPVVFYCRSGNRAGKAITELAAKGYTNIYNATGFEAMKATRP